MLDKMLIIILLLLLPLGLGGAYFLSQADKEADAESQEVSAATQTATVEDLEKMLKQMQTQSGQSQTPQRKEVQITSVIYATDSASLQVAGVAPNQQLSVTVSATVLPNEFNTPQELTEIDQDKQGVLGQAVVVRSVKPKPGGGFLYEFPIEAESGLIELTFEQDDALTVVQYDLTQQKQVM